MNNTLRIKIAPSILAADFSRLLDDIKRVEKEADLLHIDIMDGHFVPNITFGPGLLRSLKGEVNLPFDVHLMVDYPERWIEPFAEVGCEFITVHVEAASHLDRLVNFIKKRGRKAGVALNPTTPESAVEYIIPKVDLVLVMTVNPGFGAQKFIPEVLPKISAIRKIAERKNPDLEIAVDGGINEVTSRQVVEKGANILVMGSFIFNSSNPEDLIINLKRKLNSKSERSYERRSK